MTGALAADPSALAAAAPVVGAALALLIPHARASWLFAFAVMAAAAVVAIDAAARGALVSAGGAAMFSTALVGLSAALCLFAGAGLVREFHAPAAPYAAALALCCAGGWMAALLSRDWIGFALAVEVAWLAGTGVAALGDARRGALNGALRMLTSGGVSAAFMFLGVGLIAHATGTLEIAALAHGAGADASIAGLVLVLLSLSVKTALAPLHSWAGGVMGRAGAAPAMLLVVVGTTGALAAMVRIGAAAASAPHLAGAVEAAIAALGATSVAICSVQAMGASDLRRLAIYAFASQAGCVLLSVSLGSPAGFAAALVQTFALTAAMLALLGAAAAMREASFDALDGLGRRHPLAGAAVTAGALSLMGAPLTIGFLGRWRLIEAAVGAGWWWVAGVALVSSLAAVFYGGRLIERVYFRRAAVVAERDRDLWRTLTAPVLAAAIAAIGLGVEPSILLHASTQAAASIFGTAP